MYLHSISNNNDNQDIVSMGCNAALLTRRVIDNSFDILAVQAMAVVQAIDYLKCQPRISTFTERFYTEMRSLVKPIVEDEPQYQNIKKVKEYLGRLGAAKIV
jgi:histidine ammonia-lyase